MNTEDHPEPEPSATPPAKGITWVDRAQALFEVLLLAGIVSSLIATLPFMLGPAGRKNPMADVRGLFAYLLLEAAITFVLLFLVMRAHGETLKEMGLSWERWRAHALLGLAIVPILFVVNYIVYIVFLAFLPGYVRETNPLTEIIRTPQDLMLFITAALIAGGIKEEMQRAFILRRFQACLGGARLGLFLWSASFGMGHYVQGPQAVVAAGTFGLLFGIVYLARRNLVTPMVTHGAYDTIALLGYWFLAAHSNT